MEPINNTHGHLENLYKEKFPDGTLLSNPIIKKILFRKLTKFSSICRLKSRVRIKTFQTNYDLLKKIRYIQVKKLEKGEAWHLIKC